MSMRAAVIVAFSLFVGSTFVSVAQSAPVRTQTQTGVPRDSTPASAHQGVIRGTVLAADTHRPLRRARLILSGSGLTEPRTVNADAAGRFEFRGLSGGRYSLSAARNGYLRLTFGQK